MGTGSVQYYRVRREVEVFSIRELGGRESWNALWKPKCPCENTVVGLHCELCPSLCNPTFHHQDQTYKGHLWGHFLTLWYEVSRLLTLDKLEWLTRAKECSVQTKVCVSSFSLSHDWSHNSVQGSDFSWWSLSICKSAKYPTRGFASQRRHEDG